MGPVDDVSADISGSDWGADMNMTLLCSLAIAYSVCDLKTNIPDLNTSLVELYRYTSIPVMHSLHACVGLLPVYGRRSRVSISHCEI